MSDDKIRIRHLLERFGLGAGREDMAFYGRGTWQEAVDLLLDEERIDPEFQLPESFYDGSLPGLRRMSQLQGHWYERLLATRRPLAHKMTLFWHDHFATSAGKVRLAQVMETHMETLYSGSLGSFRELLLAVCRDPAMILWLDLNENKKGTPNENFARELMELFTLGVDNGYTEEDIRDVARAFTGWSYETGRRQRRMNTGFRVISEAHDDEEKLVLGARGPFGGEDIVDLLCARRATARFLSKKVWDWFAYEGAEVTFIDRMADHFYESGLEIKSLLRFIMESEEFYSERCLGTRVKNPVEFCVHSARQIGVQSLLQPENGSREAFGSLMKVSTAEMGMELLAPPDVNGWPSGLSWISTSTVLKRIKWGELLFLGEQESLTRNRRQARPLTLRELFASKTTGEFALELANRLGFEPDERGRSTLIAAAQGVDDGNLTNSNFGQVGAAVAKVIFASPRYQFH